MVKSMLLFHMLAFLVSGQWEVPHLKPNPGTYNEGNNGVCLFLTTALNASRWSDAYSEKFLFWIDKVFVSSVKNQFKTPLPNVRVFKLLIKGDPRHRKSRRFTNLGKDLGDTNVIWHSFKDYWRLVKETVLMYDCNWISSIWLDADDALLDGYFKYVTEEIPKVLTETRTSEGKPWLGGVFALRSPKWLDLGLNRCRGLFDGLIWYCGYSQGQGVILRRSVWQALNQRLFIHGIHSKWLKIVRERVMHALGHRDYVSLAGVRPFRFWDDTEEMRAYEEADAAKSQIKMFDVSENWKTSAIFLRTPFSSHFPWEFLDEIPRCTKQQINNVQRDFPQDIGFIIKAWLEHPQIHTTMLEACHNNKFFLSTNKGATCDSLEATWLKTHYYPYKIGL